LALVCQLTTAAWAKDFKLLDGSVISGEVSASDDNGVVFRLATGGFSSRINWMKLTQETLKDLADNAKARPFVEPFIEIPIEAKPKPKPIVVKDPPRVERPMGRLSFFSSFSAPLGLVALGLLYLGNLLAGYEIAIYRNRPIALVCGLSALLPLLGPLIFLVSHTLEAEGGSTEATPEAPGAPGPAVAVPGAAGGTTSRKVGVPSGGGLKVAAGPKAAEGPAGPKVYSRSEYTFNRRFIETQFAGFFRIVPSEAEKDMVLVFKTAKNEYVGRRISRISSNDLFLQLQQGGGTKEVSISFGEISQIIVRQKDDKSA